MPPTTPVVMFAPGTPAALAAGAHVIAFTQKAADGSLSASLVLVGQNGLVPPL